MVVWLLFCACALSAQDAAAQEDCFCAKDLDSYYLEIQNTASYKDQISGARRDHFDATYQGLKRRITCEETDFDCFVLLNELSYLIDDEHARLRSVPIILTSENYQDDTVIEAYRASEALSNFERSEMNLELLEDALVKEGRDSIPGIYFKSGFKVGVFQPPSTGHYNAVVLESPLRSWDKGQLVFRLMPTDKGNYRYYHANLADKRWMAISNEHFKDGRLVSLNWKKEATLPDFHLAVSESTYEYRKLQDGITYIRLGSFGANDANQEKAAAFLSTLEKQTVERDVIVDLRNNGGGGDKVSVPFQRYIEKTFRDGRILILVNIKTGSNAEIFAQRMRRRDNVTILGQPTQGVLSYGSNFGNKITLPSGKYEFKFTDMDVSKNIEFEGVGIPVDVPLRLDTDWLAQAVAVIQNSFQDTSDDGAGFRSF